MATTGGVVTFTLAEEEASRHATPPCIHVPALEAGGTVPLRLQVVFSFFLSPLHTLQGCGAVKHHSVGGPPKANKQFHTATRCLGALRNA